ITAALRQMGMIARDQALGDDGVAERIITYFQKRFLEQMTLESFSLKDIQVDMKTKLEAMADLKKLDVSFRNLSRAFQVPKEWVIFERASILLLGLGTQIDPDMNPIRTVGPFLQEFVLGHDADWKGQIAGTIREMALSAIAIPDKANRLLDLANRGDVRLQIPGLTESAILLYAAAQQILFAFLSVAIGGFTFLFDARGNRVLATLAWVAAALCFVALLGSIMRARSLRRALGRNARK
ncbi:MAG TPA: hypothetical protein VK636_06230, partial [Gemmatimonadaceae bacterium]|nr:hypothetical protein [Gemmatimonadaceae bacterium]